MTEMKQWLIILRWGDLRQEYQTESIRPGKALQRAMNFFEEEGIIKDSDFAKGARMTITIFNLKGSKKPRGN